MVYYFVSKVTDSPATIYVGKDKFENEELIKYGWEEDVWYHPFRHPPNQVSPYTNSTIRRFHVDNLSSAHVYLRMVEGQTWDQLPKELVEDCAQLTKANSIEGNKKDNVTIIYTPWSNLKKDGSMATGQVGFHDPKKTRKVLLPTRLNPTINRLLKTRLETPTSDLQPQREAHLSAQRKKVYKEKQARQKEEEKTILERREEKEKRRKGYEEIFGDEAVRERGVANQGEGEGGEGGWDEDDFM
ncbi:MAG: hypothetical protein FRX48_08404 [Lasallia pustulata]|uniref:NFACT RNA-binding domain-containing protein n=1 Tax=Lasallia pustulata TaxID=136370 RepID=A0A5M8PG27_9LECA|nr:MAG: hypothetical protein FRX48_08404 [Lasallia pustulata]